MLDMSLQQVPFFEIVPFLQYLHQNSQDASQNRVKDIALYLNSHIYAEVQKRSRVPLVISSYRSITMRPCFF